MTGRLLVTVVVATLAFWLAACSTTVTTVGGPVAAEEEAPFPECQVEAFAFAGEASLADLGFGDMTTAAEASRVGTVWVTAGRGRPMDGGASPGRFLCIEYPDGGGMSTVIPDDWAPPGAEMIETTTVAWPIVGLIAAVVAVLGAAAFAFRRD